MLSRLGESGKKLRRVRVDVGYQGTLLGWTWEHCQLILERVLRPKRQQGFVMQAHRWVANRTFAWITRGGRLSMDYSDARRRPKRIRSMRDRHVTTDT